MSLNSTIYDREDALIGKEINFTKKLSDLGLTGTFDNKSIRVVESYSNGSIKSYNSSMDEVPYYFKTLSNYDSIENALFRLEWNAPNTTNANSERYFIKALFFGIPL